MQSKTTKNSKIHEQGYTFTELYIIMGILGILFGIALLLLDPLKQKARARDSVRLTNALTLAGGIEEFISENHTPPDSDSTLRVSSSLPSGQSGPLQHASEGWIAEDMSLFLPKLPTDPLNTSPFVYSYRREGNAYEINMVLEENTERMESDRGDNDAVFEIGSDLTILN